jgi:glycine cleavage system transcriptional repressor
VCRACEPFIRPHRFFLAGHGHIQFHLFTVVAQKPFGPGETQFIKITSIDRFSISAIKRPSVLYFCKKIRHHGFDISNCIENIREGIRFEYTTPKHNSATNGVDSMNKAILSVLGHDRPGIVAAVTGILFDLNCNIENVSQTILQTEFSGSFIVMMPPGLSLDDLRERFIENLSPGDLHVHIESILKKEAVPTTRESEPFVITTKGPDRQGLVAGISEIIAGHGVNITNLQAVFKGGDDPGDNIMIYEVDIPIDIDQQELYRDLRAKAKSLKLNISIQHRNIFETINRI